MSCRTNHEKLNTKLSTFNHDPKVSSKNIDYKNKYLRSKGINISSFVPVKCQIIAMRKRRYVVIAIGDKEIALSWREVIYPDSLDDNYVFIKREYAKNKGVFQALRSQQV